MSAADAPARTFAALGDPTRLSLLRRLSDGRPRSIAVLSADTRLTRQAVTKHLRVLEGADLVRSSRAGRETHFAFHPEALGGARTYIEAVSAQWDDTLARLKAHIEG